MFYDFRSQFGTQKIFKNKFLKTSKISKFEKILKFKNGNRYAHGKQLSCFSGGYIIKVEEQNHRINPLGQWLFPDQHIGSFGTEKRRYTLSSEPCNLKVSIRLCI